MLLFESLRLFHSRLIAGCSSAHGNDGSLRVNARAIYSNLLSHTLSLLLFSSLGAVIETMATLASPASPPSTPLKRRTRSWARRVERYCCVAATYFPLAFVYSLSTWAVYVAVSVGSLSRHGRWIGMGTCRRTKSQISGDVLTIALSQAYRAISPQHSFIS